MVIGAGAVAELARFLQVMLWVAIPCILVLSGITTFIHYRNKRKNKAAMPDGEVHAFASQVAGLQPETAQYVLVDHSGLVRQYKRKLSFNIARFSALQTDFRHLSEKYTSLITSKNISSMQQDFQPDTQREQQDLPAVPTTSASSFIAMEREELLRKLDELNQSFQVLEKENAVLQAKASMFDGQEQTLPDWQEEKIALKTMIAEQEYIKDMLEEKSMQVVFLQQQLEERIKKHHQVAHTCASLEEQTAITRQQLAHAQQETNRLGSQLQDQQNDNHQLGATIHDKQQQIDGLEHRIDELRRENELLQTGVSNGVQQHEELDRELAAANNRIVLLEEKLEGYRNSLKDIFRQAEKTIGEDQATSPVIALQSVHTDTPVTYGTVSLS